MTIAESALYGDLVKYLRDQWAGQAAQSNETTLDEERVKIDELIKTWFFTPQKDLSGHTPRQIIRNEELGKPNIVPHDHLDQVFHDDCPICQLLKEDALNGLGGEWHFGLAPDLSLLDEYDPEGYDARWEEEGKKFPRANHSAEKDDDIPRSTLVEAREWLTSNGNSHPFAGNRFYDKQEALEFVNRLYDLGATMIWVTNIYDEKYRIEESGGPYADTLIAELPERDTGARIKLYDVWHHELREEQDLDVTRYFGAELDALEFWWD